jgi:hypothetical protein
VFEWDPRKAEVNAAKHRVTFDDALTVFLDPEALAGFDLPALLGGIAIPPAWTVRRRTGPHGAYTLRRSGDAEAIRIISPRRASRRERAAYAAKD